MACAPDKRLALESPQGSKSENRCFKILGESDEEAQAADYPAHFLRGAVMWGNTRAETMQHLHEVVQMLAEGLIKEWRAY